MNKITDVSIEPLDQSNFVKPRRLKYKQDGVAKIWDLLLSRPTVCVVIFNKTRGCLVLVKQFRPAVYVAAALNKLRDVTKITETLKGNFFCEWKTLRKSMFPFLEIDVEKHGITVELCAGIVDKDKPTKEIAKMEILEECGYDVPLDNIELIQTTLGHVGTSGEPLHMYYAEVTDGMRVNQGGGLAEEGEMIEVVEMSIPEVKELTKKPGVTMPSFTMHGLFWFLLNKV